MIATIPVGIKPGIVAITQDSKYAYVANFGENTVSVIRIRDNKVIKTIKVGNAASGLAIIPL